MIFINIRMYILSIQILLLSKELCTIKRTPEWLEELNNVDENFITPVKKFRFVKNFLPFLCHNYTGNFLYPPQFVQFFKLKNELKEKHSLQNTLYTGIRFIDFTVRSPAMNSLQAPLFLNFDVELIYKLNFRNSMRNLITSKGLCPFNK